MSKTTPAPWPGCSNAAIDNQSLIGKNFAKLVFAFLDPLFARSQGRLRGPFEAKAFSGRGGTPGFGTRWRRGSEFGLRLPLGRGDDTHGGHMQQRGFAPFVLGPVKQRGGETLSQQQRKRYGQQHLPLETGGPQMTDKCGHRQAQAAATGRRRTSAASI